MNKGSPYPSFAVAFASVIVFWAVLHDFHLMQVEPRHFTEFHRPLLPLKNHFLIALQYATVATLGPGLTFGFLACFACTSGPGKKVELRQLVVRFILLISLIELVLLSIGGLSEFVFLKSGSTLYPASFYPELSTGIVYTQTVNISAYLIAPLVSSIFLALIWKQRLRNPA